MGLALVTVALTAMWAGGLWLVPDHLGRAVLKSNWGPSRRLLWPMAAFTAGVTTAIAAIVGLRALDVAGPTLRVRIWAGPIVLVAGVAGAELAGASGAAIGLAASTWLSAALGWFMLRRALVRGAGAEPVATPSVGG
jgi:peptidoglycan biosynthesis protein MviN/MurJ (putative lipid II flippase)